MAEANRPLRIFVASLGDCAAEREVVRRVATQDTTIQALCRKMGTSIDVFGWEDLPPDIGRSQSHINDAVQAFDPNECVFIFWHRFGSDAGLGMTGSEEEWHLAVQNIELTGMGISSCKKCSKSLSPHWKCFKLIPGRKIFFSMISGCSQNYQPTSYLFLKV
jgi:hypothetical protein